jgi:ATP-dependent Clp protease ATP-binding subunit ClpX
MNILTEPKNALVKQYTKLLDMEGVELRFEEAALRAAVKIAQERKTGARALRSIFERAMLDTMYRIPSESDVAEVIVTEETISEGKPPKIVTQSEKKKKAG